MSEDLPTSSLWVRLFRGGVSLVPFERFLLTTLVHEVPAEMAAALRKEWRWLNLIQRSPDWQELRFYRLRGGRVDRSDLPRLPVHDGEVKLLSLALRPNGSTRLLNVNFWGVNGWFFNLNADPSYRPFRDCTTMPIQEVEHSYRSNLVRRAPS